MRQEGRVAIATLGFVAVTAAMPITLAAEAGEAKYHTHAELSAWVNRLATEHRRVCMTESIGTSREGRAIWALRLARPGRVDPDARPALLLVANLDGDHLVGSEVAMGVAEQLLAADDEAASFLDDHTIYVVPRVNPDAAERTFAAVKTGRRRNVRPDDRDRDGAIDEDPPNDLNGDGFITMMRVPNPPTPETPDRMVDPGDPRLDVEPDGDEGERATHRLYVEGVDDDGDGAFNEDPLGGVSLEMNFMHGYREHADGAGPYPVSEPESLALLQYVLAHQNIAVVLSYGVHDNLSKTPSGKGTFPAGAPKDIDANDVGLYKKIGERFREITGLERVPAEPAEGAFFDWAYAQFGVPSFTTPLWTRPEADEDEEAEKKGDDDTGSDAGDADADAGEGGDGEDAGLTPSGIGDIAMETLEELRAGAEASGFEVSDEMMSQLTPAAVEGFARRMGIEVQRVKTGGDGNGAGKDKDDAAWLAYSDARGGAGFVEWAAFDHPQLGPVEIGGWVPGFKLNPPPDAFEDLVAKQVEFVRDLGGRFPEVSMSEPRITRLGVGLYELRVALVNEGYLPTGTAMAVRNRRARPYVVRLSVPHEDVVTGQRVNKIWSIPGSGGRRPFRWIIRVDEGAEVTITVYSEKFGQFDRTVWLRDGEASE